VLGKAFTDRILLWFDSTFFHIWLSKGTLGFSKMENNDWAAACTTGIKQGKQGLCNSSGKRILCLHPCVAFPIEGLHCEARTQVAVFVFPGPGL